MRYIVNAPFASLSSKPYLLHKLLQCFFSSTSRDSNRNSTKILFLSTGSGHFPGLVVSLDKTAGLPQKISLLEA